MKPIYLDHNATTPLAPVVQEAMLPFLAEHFGNPSSSHSFGRAALEAMEDARMHVAAALGADRDEIFFTSGGTESNNLAIIGSLISNVPEISGHIITSQIEHPAVLAPIRFLENLGFEVTRLPTNRNGVVSTEDIQAALRTDTKLVSIMHANNETGVIQPLAEIAEILQDREVIFHSDGSQSFGKIPTTVDDLGVDMLAIAGHKFYAPKGVGALYVRFGTEVHPFMQGAGHERGLRPGTENVASIVGMGRACRLVSKHLAASISRMTLLRDRLQTQLTSHIPGLLVNGLAAERLPNTLSVVFPDVQGHQLLQRAPEVCASTGSACHSGSAARSATLENLGLSEKKASGTVRLSVGWYTTDAEIERSANLLIAAWEELAGGDF